jgi:D-alanyl-D-alanine carboxypeptidase
MRARVAGTLAGLGLVFAAGAAVVVLVGCGGSSSSASLSDIRSSVRQLVSGGVPGALLFVREGDRSYTVAAGYADPKRKVPMRASDTYPIGSTTKTFTGVLVMRLVAQGRIALDAPVSKYLPGLLPAGDEITIRELLAHTSGLADYEFDPLVLRPYVSGHLRFQTAPLDIVHAEARRPLLFPPGTKFNYTSTESIVLALLAESVGGGTYASQLRDHIFRPLGLHHTILPTNGDGLPDVHGSVAWSKYVPDANPVPVDSAALSPSIAWSAGGVRSTVADVADFLRGLFTGKLLPSAQVRAMENTSATGGAYGLDLMPTGGHAYYWGNYTQTINTTCGRAWGHGGNFPGYLNLPISSPDGSRQAVLLINTDPTLMTAEQLKRAFGILATAYCHGVPS